MILLIVKNRYLLYGSIILISLLAACTRNNDAPSYEASARVVDGDTIILGKQLMIRLWGIDALEHQQYCILDNKEHPCGKRAAKALQQLIHDQLITCWQKDIDRYARIIAICKTQQGLELNKEMVQKGWAIDYTYYSGGAYRLLEHQAFKAQKGMWQYDDVQNPRAWRKENLIHKGNEKESK